MQCAFEEQAIGCPAIHADFRSLLRSSSTCEPSDPPHAVVLRLTLFRVPFIKQLNVTAAVRPLQAHIGLNGREKPLAYQLRTSRANSPAKASYTVSARTGKGRSSVAHSIQ